MLMTFKRYFLNKNRSMSGTPKMLDKFYRTLLFINNEVPILSLFVFFFLIQPFFYLPTIFFFSILSLYIFLKKSFGLLLDRPS